LPPVFPNVSPRQPTRASPRSTIGFRSQIHFDHAAKRVSEREQLLPTYEMGTAPLDLAESRLIYTCLQCKGFLRQTVCPADLPDARPCGSICIILLAHGSCCWLTVPAPIKSSEGIQRIPTFATSGAARPAFEGNHRNEKAAARPTRAPRSRPPPSRRSTGWLRSCVWTCRRHAASARRVSCAWVISVQARPAPSQREPRQCRFADHPTAPVTPVHSLVAIARNGWSRSIGTLGRNQLESVVAISRCAHVNALDPQPMQQMYLFRLRSGCVRPWIEWPLARNLLGRLSHEKDLGPLVLSEDFQRGRKIGQSSELPIDRGHPDWKIETSEQGANPGEQLVHKGPRITHWTQERHLPTGIYPHRARNPALLCDSAPVSVEQTSKRYKN